MAAAPPGGYFKGAIHFLLHRLSKKSIYISVGVLRGFRCFLGFSLVHFLNFPAVGFEVVGLEFRAHCFPFLDAQWAGDLQFI
jgi:hypothetical protein